MPFPVGVWKIDANGYVGNMEIDGYSYEDGILDGVLTIDEGHRDGLTGFWNEASQSIIFQRLGNNADPSSVQVYTGYLFKDPLNNAASPYTLAGYFETFAPPGGGSALRSVYGWYAQWTAPPPPPSGIPGGAGGSDGSGGRPGTGGPHGHPEE
jgi:hypothetical protein